MLRLWREEPRDNSTHRKVDVVVDHRESINYSILLMLGRERGCDEQFLINQRQQCVAEINAMIPETGMIKR